MEIPKSYNIKLEDKAAFINKAESLGVNIETFDIKDNELKGIFTITFYNPEEIETVKQILKSSPKIDVMKEYIKNVIKEEIKNNLEK